MGGMKNLQIEVQDLQHENEQLLAAVEGLRKERREFLKRIATLENLLHRSG